MALHVADGIERLVFVPQVPYSGSLKSHLTAPLALVLDPARAFALVSVLFYLAYVAGLYRLALLVSAPRTAVLAGLYAAFSPAFVTRYSLSNDGNYVEVLALGTWALWLAARWTREDDARPRLAFAAGLLLGLGFWCHILAIIPWRRSRLPSCSPDGSPPRARSLALGARLGRGLRARLALERLERLAVVPLPAPRRGARRARRRRRASPRSRPASARSCG